MKQTRYFVLALLTSLVVAGSLMAGPTQEHQNATQALIDSVAAARPPCPPCPNPVPVPDPTPVPNPGQVPDMTVACLGQGHGYSPTRFWRNWCVRDNSGGPFPPKATRWGDGPGNPPQYGIMYRNTQGCMTLPPELGKKGWVSFDVFFDTNTVPDNYGGKHVFSISSAFFNSDLGPGRYSRGWCRPDFSVRDGKARLSYYQADGEGNVIEDHQAWVSNQSLNATQRWIHIKVAWDRFAADKMKITLNDAESKTLTVHRDAEEIQHVYFGNMDRSILKDGTVPTTGNMDGNGQIFYRNIRWGR